MLPTSRMGWNPDWQPSNTLPDGLTSPTKAEKRSDFAILPVTRIASESSDFGKRGADRNSLTCRDTEASLLARHVSGANPCLKASVG